MDSIQNILDKELQIFRQQFAQKLLDKGYSTNLAEKTKWTIQADDLGYSITIDMPDYAWYLEYGTHDSKPHMPPLQAILDWVHIKHILPRAVNGKLPSEVQLAWAIAKSAEKKGLHGMKPTHIVSNTLKDTDLMKRIYNIVGEELLKSLKIEANK